MLLYMGCVTPAAAAPSGSPVPSCGPEGVELAIPNVHPVVGALMRADEETVCRVVSFEVGA